LSGDDKIKHNSNTNYQTTSAKVNRSEYLKDALAYLCRASKRERYPRHFNKLTFKFGSVIHYLTWRCNSKCITCNCWKTSFDVRNKEVWNVESVKKIYQTLDTESVFLTGGEPTIIPKFKEIAYIIYQTSGATISFATNGLAVTRLKNILLYLKENDVPFRIHLSCNGFEKTHDFSRGIDGSYKKNLELMKFFEENKIPFSLLYTIFPFNIDETINFVEYWRNKNIDVDVMVGRMDSRYKINEDCKKYVTFSEKDYQKMEQVLLQLSNTYPGYTPLYYLIKELNNGKKIFPCFGLYNRIVLDPYGNVYPCDGLPQELLLGNLKSVNFDFNFFITSNRAKIKEVFESIKNKKCQPCMYICDLVGGVSLTLPRRHIIRVVSNQIRRKVRSL